MWTLYILVNNLKMPTTITVITNHFKKKKNLVITTREGRFAMLDY